MKHKCLRSARRGQLLCESEEERRQFWGEEEVREVEGFALATHSGMGHVYVRFADRVILPVDTLVHFGTCMNAVIMRVDRKE